jgi:hypothetical protein
MVRFILLTALALSACLPSQHDPKVYGTHYVTAIDNQTLGVFTPEEQQSIGRAIDALDALGPEFVAVNALDPRAEVYVVRWHSPDCATEGAGYYDHGTAFVYVDPSCASSADMLSWVVAHEVMHWYTWHDFAWGGHICNGSGAPADHCHPSIVGPALLNPRGGPWYHPSENDLSLIRALARGMR